MQTRFALGDITIDRIVEGEVPGGEALHFFPTLTPELLEENRGWLEEAGALQDGRVVLCMQSYLVRTPHHTILIDTCNGNDKPRRSRPQWHLRTDETYMRNLAAAGVSVGDIDLVMCTHLHVDHVGWNTRLENGRWVPTFPNARYLFAQRELDYWTALNARKPITVIGDSVLPIVEAGRADPIPSDHALDDHVRLEPTPGHTIDHFAVQLGRGRTGAVVTGDLIHSPLQARYPALNMAAEYDPAQAASTRRGFLERYCDGETLVCTAHFPSPSAGRLARWGDGFRLETQGG